MVIGLGVRPYLALVVLFALAAAEVDVKLT